MPTQMECDVLGDSGRSDPFLHRLLRPAPFQTFEYQTGLFWTIAYQFQCFIAYLGDGMDTFSSGSEVDDFFPAKGKNIAESQTGQTRKEGSGLQNRYLARGFGKAIQLFHAQIVLHHIFRLDLLQKIIDIGLDHPVAVKDFQESSESGPVSGSRVPCNISVPFQQSGV